MIRYNKLLFIIVIISLASFSANAQQGNTMYYIDNVPQSNELNPARQHRCKVHLGCPALSQIYFTGENTGFTYNDIVQSVPGNNDEIVLFLNEQGIGKDEFLSDLPKVGYASVEASSRMASLGLRLDRYYFTFNINQKFFGRFSYPKEYFSLLLEGNVVDGQYQSYDLSNLAVDIKSYREYALGVSEQINDQWNFGVRLKILFGQFNFNLENNSKLQTTQDQWILPKDALNLNTSIPGVEVTDSSGMLEEVKTTEAFEDDAGSFITDEFLSHKNLGVAIDFGAIYRMNDQFEFSLSILDIGSISWKNNVANMSQKAEFNFEGYRIATLDQDSIVERDFVDELVDSAGFEVTNESYTTGLPAKIYLGGRWFANEVVSFGILSKTEIYH